jgi:hypothetical protein
MNESGWARGSDCKIVQFGLLALARRGGRASNFLVETPPKIKGKSSGGTFGGDGKLTSDRHNSGNIQIESIICFNCFPGSDVK